MSAVLTSTATSSLNFPSVNFQLMRGLLLTAKQNAPFYGPTKAGILMKNQGTNAVKWERLENLAIASTPLAELGTPLSLPTRNAVAPTLTPVTATVLKYGNAIYHTDNVELEEMNARAANFMRQMGENAGRSLNAVLEAEYASATNVRLGGGVGAVTGIVTSMSLNDMKFTVAELNENDVNKFFPMTLGSTNINTTPIRESLIGICHSFVEQDIRDLTGFTPVERYGSQIQTMPGEFGEVEGVRWASTSLSTMIEANAATTSTAGFRGANDTQNNVFDSYILGMEAVGSVGLGEKHTEEMFKTGDVIPAVEIIQKPLGSAGAADPLNEVGSTSWKAWLVAKILNEDWIFRVRTLAREF